MKSIIREFLTFSNTEKRGIIILFSLVLVLQGVRTALPYFSNEMGTFSDEELQMANKWLQQMEVLKKAEIEQKRALKKRKLPACFTFNPNSIGQNDWLKLGFSEKETSSIQKFISKGGKFVFKEDLKKLYCVDESIYAQLEQCISLPGKRNHEPIQKSNNINYKTCSKKANKIVLLEFNGADTLELLSLRGVGKYWAKKLWFFKERLGGIYNEEQLYEIKGMNDSIFYNIQSQIKIDTGKIVKIPINTCRIEELQKHPYCWYGIGKAIVNYRSKHGPFESLTEIQKIYAVKPEIFEKLRHYLVLK
jgi:competence protein ComEA